MKSLKLSLLLFLCACSASPNVCPELVHYTKSDQQVLAEELSQNDAPQTTRWIGDYIGLRDQVRACGRKE